MRVFPVLAISWLLTGFGALLGSILGNAAGPQGLKAGAMVGGVLALLAGVAGAKRFGWLPAGEARGGFLGGLVGFALAVAITLTHMQTPIVPVLSCSLVGVGVLLGAGVARGRARS